MTQDRTQIVNEHLQQNSSSDSTEEVRRRKRMAELQAEREKNRQERRPGFQSASGPQNK
ncbi:MAG TPA: hypothetical protein VFW40_03535 [Capsulimonadaceae bacterium]|nr:hypothetical protein [Capsulimonadaceae bacterium]